MGAIIIGASDSKGSIISTKGMSRHTKNVQPSWDFRSKKVTDSYLPLENQIDAMQENSSARNLYG